MDWKLFSVTFATVFLAEMGDKTQLATMALTGESKKMVTVFLGAASALVIATLIGVLVGGVLSRYVPENIIRKVAALFFILTGILFFFGKL
ncbi:MAG: TMEM165/GDT1 family protein [Nitrospiraceae bacterium]|nr:TMEM165/GDT1 family protein [Nitrospiraceae bacterium]